MLRPARPKAKPLLRTGVAPGGVRTLRKALMVALSYCILISSSLNGRNRRRLFATGASLQSSQRRWRVSRKSRATVVAFSLVSDTDHLSCGILRSKSGLSIAHHKEVIGCRCCPRNSVDIVGIGGRNYRHRLRLSRSPAHADLEGGNNTAQLSALESEQDVGCAKDQADHSTFETEPPVPVPAPVVSPGTKMSRQEEVLASLGLSETEEEKAQRIAKREAAQENIDRRRRNNVFVAAFSVIAAIANYLYQYSHPISAVQLLSEMQASSAPLTAIGRDGRPSVVDFWAPWCENCKAAAPTLRLIESEYRDRVNFVMVNGDLDSSWGAIEKFNVDAIPHLALVSSEGDVETALIGPVPASVLRADLDALIENAKLSSAKTSAGADGSAETSKRELPYTMYDAFRTQPERRRVSF